ncbi:S-(hydroxymethyl)glutathione synthase [Ostertagia ostertagi]
MAGEHFFQGGEHLITYTFNTHQAKHKFCRICGVQSFYVPRSNPDSIGIMPHCIDSPTVKELRFTAFDGEHWEEEMQKKAPIPI